MKKLALLFAAILIVVGLAGCHSSSAWTNCRENKPFSGGQVTSAQTQIINGAQTYLCYGYTSQGWRIRWYVDHWDHDIWGVLYV